MCRVTSARIECTLFSPGGHLTHIYLLLIGQLFVHAETVAIGCALDLLLQYGKIQFICRRMGWRGAGRQQEEAVTCFCHAYIHTSGFSSCGHTHTKFSVFSVHLPATNSMHRDDTSSSVMLAALLNMFCAEKHAKVIGSTTTRAYQGKTANTDGLFFLSTLKQPNEPRRDTIKAFCP